MAASSAMRKTQLQALLIIGAGVVKGWAAYVLWAAALILLALSPLIIRVRGRFDIQPSVARLTIADGAFDVEIISLA